MVDVHPPAPAAAVVVAADIGPADVAAAATAFQDLGALVPTTQKWAAGHREHSC